MNQFRYGLMGVAAAGALLLGGCASSPTTYSAADNSQDFGQYQTYAFVDELATDGEEYQSLESTYLKTSVAREMERRGFRQADQPDLVINFTIESEEKVRSRSVPAGGLYGDPYYDYDYDYGYGYGMAYRTHIDQYTEGKLNILAVDPEAGRMVWQGTTRSRITQKDLENAHQTLDGAVVEIFSQFPVPARDVAGTPGS